MNFELPIDLQEYISRLDAFIDRTILPLQHKDDNNRFFDHRREPSRTQWDNGGLPTPEWESLLTQARKLADAAGFYRFPIPKRYGGQEHPSTNLWMCALRYHMASHPVYGGGVSLANDLQNEHSVVGNFPDFLMLYHWGNAEQKAQFIPARLAGEFRMTFGLTEIHHGSDATHMDTRATPCKLANGVSGYSITGNKKWQTGAHSATHFLVFARTSGKDGSPRGITAFIVPRGTSGTTIKSYEYTLNMPTDHATILLDDVKVPASAVLGPLENGLAIAQTFTHENRIRQAASSCGAAKFCIDRSVAYARQRIVFGKPLSANQAVQWPLVELSTQAEMLRLLILRTANEMDDIQRRYARDSSKPPWVAIEEQLGHKINNAIQVHGGNGYSRHEPFEHIWRHFRRYRITEGSEEVQMRKVAGYLFGYKSTGLSGTEACLTPAERFFTPGQHSDGLRLLSVWLEVPAHSHNARSLAELQLLATSEASRFSVTDQLFANDRVTPSWWGCLRYAIEHVQGGRRHALFSALGLFICFAEAVYKEGDIGGSLWEGAKRPIHIVTAFALESCSYRCSIPLPTSFVDDPDTGTNIDQIANDDFLRATPRRNYRLGRGPAVGIAGVDRPHPQCDTTDTISATACPLGFKSSGIRFQIPSVTAWFGNIKFLQAMRTTETYKFISRILYSLRTTTRRTIWGDRLFLQFRGPTTILMSSRGSRISDVLTKEEVNEIADAPAGAVPEAVDLATKPSLEAPTKVDEPTVRVRVASIGQDGKAHFADAKNVEDFEKLKS
ncbi:putative Acyl-CoA dehydrogenase [Seiridium unicorne]|uniref:Acyl-CoA dehydrogenase n=1 Tax=Seiridium unicorne TaxID=138068 RepID=A0ABR2UK17_9PEZI